MLFIGRDEHIHLHHNSESQWYRAMCETLEVKLDLRYETNPSSTNEQGDFMRTFHEEEDEKKGFYMNSSKSFTLVFSKSIITLPCRATVFINTVPLSRSAHSSIWIVNSHPMENV